MTHLLAFHLGPVQEFIATARRTQDWWLGSWLLANLSQMAIGVAQQEGATLVLPNALQTSPNPAVADTPNHFIVRILDGNGTETAQKTENAVRNEWQRIHREVKRKFFDQVADVLWTRQLDNFLEIYWAIVPDDGSKEARNQTQAALDARKRLRDFVWTEEHLLKCTLCGARQELSGATFLSASQEWWQQLVRIFQGRLRVREDGSERLCAVCSVKRAALRSGSLQSRLSRDDGYFPSTSSVAASMFKRQLLATAKGQSELAEHLRVLEEIFVPAQVDEDSLPGLLSISTSLPQDVRRKVLTFDGDLFYPETFTEKRICEEFPGTPSRILKAGAEEMECTEEELLDLEPTYVSQEINRAVQSLRALVRAVYSDDPTEHIWPPSKYFAVLKMDGDHMGKFFSQVEEQPAQAVSQSLSRFAHSQAGTIVDKHYGRLVYAGGDDALALLPLIEVLPCAQELQEAFKKAISSVTVPSGVTRPTLSVGITIAHHTAPLDGVLTTLQRAEKAAKSPYEYGRDAVCVHILKRSGEEVRVGSHWQYEELDILSVLQQLITAFQMENLSMRFAQSVAGEARGLGNHNLPSEARLAALKRLARRHCADGQESIAESLAQKLASWAEGQRPFESAPLGLAEMANWILLARFIASGGRDEE